MSFAFLVEHLVLGRATTTSHLAFCKKKTEKKPLVTCLIYEEMTRAMPLAFVMINGLLKKMTVKRVAKSFFPPNVSLVKEGKNIMHCLEYIWWSRIDF